MRNTAQQIIDITVRLYLRPDADPTEVVDNMDYSFYLEDDAGRPLIEDTTILNAEII
jgi:hypothetical protein